MEAPWTPEPRGDISSWLIDRLLQPVHEVHGARRSRAQTVSGEGLPCALYALYELHYRGFEGVDECWEWDPSLLAFRAGSKRVRGRADRARSARCRPMPKPEMDLVLLEILSGRRAVLGRLLERPGPSMSSANSSFTVGLPAQGGRPSLVGDPAAVGQPEGALVEIQSDEYGRGDPARSRSVFAETMDAWTSTSRYGEYST